MITENYKVISPAYGRDYRSAKEADAAFRAAVDFRMESPGHGGTYCSIRDFAAGTIVSVRHAKLAKVVNVTV